MTIAKARGRFGCFYFMILIKRVGNVGTFWSTGSVFMIFFKVWGLPRSRYGV